jgi:hypothetical protein
MNCFEHGFAIALMYAEFLIEQKDIFEKLGREKFDRDKYESEFDRFFDVDFAQTTGNLLKRLERSLNIPDELKKDIAYAKQRRDFLAHHFFRDRAEDILTRSGLDKMIDELIVDQGLFQHVDKCLQEATASLRSRLGIKDEMLEKYFQKILQRIKNEDT